MSEKIMIVEDEGLVALELEECLQQMGYTVSTTVSSGAQAIAKAAETHPDLVLMDISLAGELDGIETATRVKDLLAVPIIFLSGYSDQKMLKKALSVDRSGFFLKPFNIDELVILVEKMMSDQFHMLLMERERLDSERNS